MFRAAKRMRGGTSSINKNYKVPAMNNLIIIIIIITIIIMIIN